MDNNVNILPDSRLRETKDVKRFQTPNRTISNWVPIFCANCGKSGGSVPQENCSFAFYLCDPCCETHGGIAGTYMMPDDVFWAKVHNEEKDKYGKNLTHFELDEVLKDDHNTITKLLRERPR
jgi:hypothetical protein